MTRYSRREWSEAILRCLQYFLSLHCTLLILPVTPGVPRLLAIHKVVMFRQRSRRYFPGPDDDCRYTTGVLIQLMLLDVITAILKAGISQTPLLQAQIHDFGKGGGPGDC